MEFHDKIYLTQVTNICGLLSEFIVITIVITVAAEKMPNKIKYSLILPKQKFTIKTNVIIGPNWKT